MKRALRLTLPVDPRPRRDVGPPFRRLNAGWLALDFVNTVPGWLTDADADEGRDWRDRIAGERLVGYEDLVLWARLEELIDDATAGALKRWAAGRSAEASAVVERARTLRQSLFRLFRAGMEGWEPLPGDLETLNGELRRLARREVLVPGVVGYSVIWSSDTLELESLLWPPLRSALTLLMRPKLLARVGRCGGPDCGWLFVDVGRGRSRRWCDIRDCGNVAKVRAYRRRQRQGPD